MVNNGAPTRLHVSIYGHARYNPSLMREDAQPFVIVAIMTLHSDSLGAFREYETEAAVLMARYGGAIERTITEEPLNAQSAVREVHIVTFPSREAFQRYRSDPDLAHLADLRTAAIAHTQLIVGRDGSDYLAPSKATEI